VGGRKEYKAWVVSEILNHSFTTAADAYDKANQWVDSPRYEESYARWKELNRDIILFANPATTVKFPDV